MQVLYGMLLSMIAQILTFLQLQGNVKYGWFQKYPIILLGMAIPISYLFIKSVEYMVAGFDGSIWESRFLGFALGMIVFAVMSKLLFSEPFTMKTMVSLILATAIICIQIFWK
jgi:multidrug transporter EmrE-like cation transporter